MLYTSALMMRRAAMPILIILLTAVGCVQRTVSIDSQPQGALVFLNGEEAGRTPLARDFIWYGTYDVVVRKEGYQTLRTRQPIIAPWWQWPPIDLFAELFPLKDARAYSYPLQPTGDPSIDVDAILARSGELQSKLQSSRVPTTRPTGK